MDPLFSPEFLLSPERLFGAVVEWRRTLIDRSSVEAAQALGAMREIHPEREYQNRKLFMSSVARNTDIFGSVVESDHDPLLANVTPIRRESPEVVETEKAHIAYLNAVSGDLRAEKEATITDEVARQRDARQRIELYYGKEAA